MKRSSSDSTAPYPTLMPMAPKPMVDTNASPILRVGIGVDIVGDEMVMVVGKIKKSISGLAKADGLTRSCQVW